MSVLPLKADIRQRIEHVCLVPQADVGGLAAREGRLVDGHLGAASGRRASPGPANGSNLPAGSASAEELIAAIGLEPRHAYSRRHLETLQDLSRSRINSPQIALVTFPGAVPELSVDPGDPGDEAVGLDGAKNRACVGPI